MYLMVKFPRLHFDGMDFHVVYFEKVQELPSRCHKYCVTFSSPTHFSEFLTCTPKRYMTFRHTFALHCLFFVFCHKYCVTFYLAQLIFRSSQFVAWLFRICCSCHAFGEFTIVTELRDVIGFFVPVTHSRILPLARILPLDQS